MNLAPLIRRPKIFYGWWMVALSGFITSLNKTAVNRGFPVFILPVEEYFGASRATVSFVFSLARSESGPSGPLAGWLVDRYGPKAALFLGATMSAVGFLLLGQMSQATSIWGFALIYIGVVTIGTNIGFSYAMSGLLNNWFYRRKAMAMSVFHAVDSIIPALLVPVVALAIINWGLQFTFNAIGIILLVTVLPLTLLIRNDPESMGLTMDGDPAIGANAPEGEAAQDDRLRHWVQPRDYAVREALRTFSFWVLVTGTALRLVAKAAVMLHIIPIIVSKGFSQQESAVLFSILMVATIPLYLILGWLGDRFPKHWVMVAAAVGGAGSFTLLALPWQGLGVVLGFVALFAVAEASAPTNWAVLGEYFGRKTFSQLRGIIMFINFPVVLLAPVFVGRWFDNHGSYDFPLWVFAAVFALGALTFAIMRNPLAQAALADADAEPAARA